MIHASRLLVRTAAAAALCWSAASSAATPTDYAMPYAADSHNGLRFKGIVLVNSANFSQSQRLVAKSIAVGSPSTLISGDLDDTGLHNLRPHSLVWAQEGHWLRASLRDGLAPTPAQVSSEADANQACDHEVIYRDFTVANQTMIFYRMPGGNATCNDNDDVIRWIGANDAAGTDPSTMTGFDRLDLEPIYQNDGKLVAIYTLQGGAILRIASDLTNTTTVKTGVSRFEVVGSLPDATVLALIDGNIERIRPNGALAPNPLRQPRSGYRINQALLHEGEVFYAEKAKDAATPFQTRVGRVAADGATGAIPMLSLRLPASIEGFTANQLIYTVDNDEADTVTLFSYPKDVAEDAAVPTKIFRADANDIAVFTTNGNNVFFNVTGVTLFPALVFNSAAYVYTAAGERVKFYGAGSSFLGGQITDSGAGALEQVQTFERVLLGTKGRVDTPNIASAKLHSLNPGTLAASPLVDLQDRMQPLLGFGFGPGSIGALLNLDNEATDVFAFDLVGARYKLLSDTSPLNEFPFF